MKRHYCDLCNTEMSYKNKAIRNTNEAKNTLLVSFPSQNKTAIEVSLSIQVKASHLIPREDNRPQWERNCFDSPMLEPVRQHADLCEACRWALIEQLRAGHSLANDTTMLSFKAELNWGAPTD